MFTWKRGLLLLCIVLLSTWITYLYLKTLNSPLMVWSEWVSAIERGSIADIQRLSEWNSEPINEEQAEQIIQTLQRHPGWKHKIYQDLQQQAVKLVRPQQSNPSHSWFQFVRNKGIHYKVNIPSFYFTVAGGDQALILSVNNMPYTSAAEYIGPIMATETEVSLIYQNAIAEIEEQIQLNLSELWGEEYIHMLPTSPLSAYFIRSNYMGGDLFIDDHYAGAVHGRTQFGPLAYQNHELRLERTLPWGIFYSKPVQVSAAMQEVFIPLDLVNEGLIEQLGEALVRYNMSWTQAVRTGNPQLLDAITPSLREQMGQVFRSQTDQTYFSGEFIQVLIEPNSIQLLEPSYEHFVVKLLAREDFIAGKWVTEYGDSLSSYESRRYWEYVLTYDPDSGWQVADFIEYKPKPKKKQSWIAFHGNQVLRIGIDAGLPPFESIKNGELYGLDVDIMRWLGERMGVKIYFIERPWNQIIDQVGIDGELDGAISAIDEKLALEIGDTIASEAYLIDIVDPDKRYVIVLRQDLSAMLQELNEWINRLQNTYEEEYIEMLERYF